MRIELNAGGLSGMLTIHNFQSDFGKLIKNSESTISSLESLKKQIYTMNGGAGSLQDAMNDVDSRLRLEERRYNSLIDSKKLCDDFVATAKRIDEEVAKKINPYPQFSRGKVKRLIYRVLDFRFHIFPNEVKIKEHFLKKMLKKWFDGVAAIKNAAKNIVEYYKSLKNNYYKAKEKHYSRNKYNTNVPKTRQELLSNPNWQDEWKVEKADYCHMPIRDIIKYYLTGKKDIIKYVSIDGSKEVIFDKNGNSLTDPRYYATYNYASPENYIEHTQKDIIPWILWGNSEDDSSSVEWRIANSIMGLIALVFQNFLWNKK